MEKGPPEENTPGSYPAARKGPVSPRRPRRECGERGCTLKLSEHWFEHEEWHPHEPISVDE